MSPESFDPRRKYYALLRMAFEKYLVVLDQEEFEPREGYLPYRFAEVDRRKLRLLAGEMIQDEIRELTNRINNWMSLLKRWHAWNSVIDAYDETDAWDLRSEFVEPVAHYCLLQPSSIRDALAFVATNMVHQVRLAEGGGYRDSLAEDRIKAGDRPRHLTRAKKERQLADLLVGWPRAIAFMSGLQSLDNQSYREVTSDYRNRNSHAIGPRIAFGTTNTVTRSVHQATKMVEQPDGGFLDEPVPGKFAVSYGFGGTAPLDVHEARKSNLEQFQIARSCFEVLLQDLFLNLARMGPLDSTK